MQRYLVGGAVRDGLLGLPVQDRDYVVVGATPAQMLAEGYTPVGKDFPVFLHPQTHEEHALARTERKTAPGYQGFVFHAASDVTLEQDLARRDLTINAMAQAEDGSIVDPFGGRTDLRDRILRHVSPAFLEDPVRILRLARFAARFTDFTVAPETMRLMHAMVENGEVDALVPERVWQEFSRGLLEARPSRMIEVLRTCGALARLLPQLAALWVPAAHQDALPSSPVSMGEATLAHLDAAAQARAALPVRLAVLLQATVPRHAGPRAVDALEPPALAPADTAPIDAACRRLKVPGDCSSLALMTGRERDAVLAGGDGAQSMLALLERCDALRKPARFHEMLDALGFLGTDATAPDTIAARWRSALTAAQAVDAGAIAAQMQRSHPGQPLQINQAVRSARVEAIRIGLGIGSPSS